MRTSLIVWLCLLSSLAAAGRIHRWVDAQGEVHYSDAPPMQGESTAVELPPPTFDPNAVNRLRRQTADYIIDRAEERLVREKAVQERRAKERIAYIKRDAERRLKEDVRKAKRERMVIPGMTEEDVAETWNPPHYVSKTATKNGIYKRYSWHGSSGGYSAVHFENGIVTSVTH